jgi:RNA polymerase sigma factor (sigma-70 family)
MHSVRLWFGRHFIDETKMTDTQTLLADYARTGDEAAFRELVSRYLGLVYSTALRVVGGDTHLAEDVAQMVFIDLARKAPGLAGEVMLGGWLHRRAYHIAAPILRAQRRRQSRERESVLMNVPQNDSGPDLARVAPVLDEVITRLGRQDRAAIMLRFFERRDFRSIGQALGSTEDAARMRVNRALEKLLVLLKRRKVTLSAAALGAVLAGEDLVAAPSGLAMSIAVSALIKSSAGAAIPAALLKCSVMTKLQTMIVSAMVVAGVATSLVIQHQGQFHLREENNSLRRQIAQLQSDTGMPSNRVAQPLQPSSLTSERLRELLRLRGEIGLLRQQLRDLRPAAIQSNPSNNSGKSTSGGSPQADQPGPFQVRLVLDGPGENSEPLTNNANGTHGEALQVQKTPLMDYTAIRSATVATDPSSGEARIDVEFSEVGAELFAAITRENINKRLAIVVDGHLYSAPVIRSEISQGKAQITGSFTEEEARALAAKINDAISGE